MWPYGIKWINSLRKYSSLLLGIGQDNFMTPNLGRCYCVKYSRSYNENALFFLLDKLSINWWTSFYKLRKPLSELSHLCSWFGGEWRGLKCFSMKVSKNKHAWDCVNRIIDMLTKSWGQFHKTILWLRSVMRPTFVIRSILAVSRNFHILW